MSELLSPSGSASWVSCKRTCTRDWNLPPFMSYVSSLFKIPDGSRPTKCPVCVWALPTIRIRLPTALHTHNHY